MIITNIYNVSLIIIAHVVPSGGVAWSKLRGTSKKTIMQDKRERDRDRDRDNYEGDRGKDIAAEVCL